MSEEDKKLIGKSDVGKNAEVVGALVNKLSGTFPVVARWKAEAEETTLHNMIKQEDIARRAGFRILRHQGNIEDIAHLAAEDMPPGSAQKIRDLDADWADDVAEKCKTASNKEMQSLWAKILVGETTKQGSFSKSTVDTVGKMSKEDALMFSDFCQFVWGMGSVSEKPVPLIYDSEGQIYQGQSRMFETAKHLDYLRLISFDGIGGYSQLYQALPVPGVFPIVWWFYHGVCVSLLNVPREQGGSRHEMNTGLACFTEAGKQLYHICNPPKNDAFFQYILERWRNTGYNPVVQKKGERE